jgi:predicted nucleic-acid-binding Zn-ribbon protein
MFTFASKYLTEPNLNQLCLAITELKLSTLVSNVHKVEMQTYFFLTCLYCLKTGLFEVSVIVT